MKNINTPAVSRHLAILFWVLSAICMGIIFWLSSRTADESSAQSDIFAAFLAFLIKDNDMRILVVRKTAHCLEYTGLALLLSGAWYFTKGKPLPHIAVLSCSLYAVTDEIHQLFVEGRSCEALDWGIDTIGALLGAAAFAVLALVARTVIGKQKR